MNGLYKYLGDAVGVAAAAGVASVLLNVIGVKLGKYVELLMGIAVLCALLQPLISAVYNGDLRIPSYADSVYDGKYESFEELILRKTEQTAASEAKRLACEKFMLSDGELEIFVTAEYDGDNVTLVACSFEGGGIKRNEIRKYLSEILDCEVEYG